jgi:NAD(P)H-flavin reductase
VETRDTFTLTIEPTAPGQSCPFTPGQFNMLTSFGVGEVPISMSGPPGDGRKLVHTLRAVGPVTQSFQQLARAAIVGVRGPFGRGWPLADAAGADIVLVAGGIGLAPLRPLVYQLLANRRQFGRVSLLVGARSPDDMLYAKELERWRGRFDIDVGVTVDRAHVGWRGHVGVVTTLVPRAPFDPRSAMAYVCGPEVMMQSAARDLELRGVPAARIWVSMERNMKCGVGLCGHCQLGPTLICRDGPVYRYDKVAPLMAIREL